jgi:hypothetical protein
VWIERSSSTILIIENPKALSFQSSANTHQFHFLIFPQADKTPPIGTITPKLTLLKENKWKRNKH